MHPMVQRASHKVLLRRVTGLYRKNDLRGTGVCSTSTRFLMLRKSRSFKRDHSNHMRKSEDCDKRPYERETGRR